MTLHSCAACRPRATLQSLGCLTKSSKPGGTERVFLVGGDIKLLGKHQYGSDGFVRRLAIGQERARQFAPVLALSSARETVKDIAKEFSGLIDSAAQDVKVLQDTKQSLVAQQTAAPKWWERVASSRVRGLVMLNLLVLLCGTNWVVVKDAGATFDPYLFASLRFLVASLVFAPGLLSAVRNETVLKGGVEVGIYTAMGYLLQSEGLLTTDASRASFLSTFTVLVVPFLAGLSGRGVRPVTWASSLAALVGVSLLEQNGSSPPCLGDIWSGLSAVAFGVQMYRTEHWSRVLGKDNAFALMSVVLTTTALLSTLAAALTHPGESLHLLETLFANSTESMDIPWKEVLYTVLTTDVVLLMEVVALNDVSSVEAAIIYTLEPVIGAAFAFIFLHERWGPMGWVGSGIIVASCLASQLLNQDTE
eukprot:jgi/Picre1/30224/NNA_005592.t1